MYFLIGLLIVSTLVTIGLWQLYLLIHSLGKQRKWVAPIPENEIIAVMRGDALQRFISNIPGKHIDRNGRVVDGKDSKSLLFLLMGHEFIGPPPVFHILGYDFNWVGIVTKKDEKNHAVSRIDVRDETVYSMLYRFTYVHEVRNVDLKGNIRARMLFYLTIEVVDVYKAMFGIKPTGRWLKEVQGRVSSIVNTVSRDLDFNDLKEDKSKSDPKDQDPDSGYGGDSVFVSQIMNLNTGDVGIENVVGVKIIHVEFAEFAPESEDQSEEVRNALTAKTVAIELAHAKVEEARGKAEAMNLLTDAEEKRFAMLEKSPHRVELKKFEHIRDSNIAILGHEGTIIPSINIGDRKEKIQKDDESNETKKGGKKNDR